MTRRQEIIEEIANKFVDIQDVTSRQLSRSHVEGHMDLIYEFDFCAAKIPGVLEYSRPHLEGAVFRRVKELLEEQEEKRPVLVNVLTGEEQVGPKGMSPDNFFEMMYS